VASRKSFSAASPEGVRRPSYRSVRRRRRRARLRVFTNVRTATRNLDLPLAARTDGAAAPFRRRRR
jgi:hypothetical protein